MPLPPRPSHLSDLEFTRVLTTYVSSAPLARDRTVLDAGCGSGHGAWLFRASGAARVVAVDLDPRALRELAKTDAEVRWAAMDVESLALRDGLFDLLACFEVIEHVPHPSRLLAELRRVAGPHALTLISTPNRVNRLRPGQRPWNPDHFREYDHAGLATELGAAYPAVVIMGTHGRPDLHERYLREWAVGIGESRARAAARRLVPHGLRAALRSVIARGADDGPGVPEPDAASWPFFLADASPRCLNFFAVCGDDPAAVNAAAASLRRGG